MLRDYRGNSPVIDKTAFVTGSADIIGSVSIGAKSSVWFGAVIRGDFSPIDIGEGTSIQDNVVLHCDDKSPMRIGNNVTVGHGAMIHGSTVGNNVLVGMGAIILNGSVIGDNCIIAAGALIKENSVIPPNSMMAGVPARLIRTLSPEQIAQRQKESNYVALARTYLEQEG